MERCRCSRGSVVNRQISVAIAFCTVVAITGCGSLGGSSSQNPPPWTAQVQPGDDRISPGSWSAELTEELLDERTLDSSESSLPDVFASAQSSELSDAQLATSKQRPLLSLFAASLRQLPVEAIIAIIFDDANRLQAAADALGTLNNLVAGGIQGEVEALQSQLDSLSDIKNELEPVAGKILQHKHEQAQRLRDPQAVELPPAPRNTPVRSSVAFLEPRPRLFQQAYITAHWKDAIGGVSTEELYRHYDSSSKEDIIRDHNEFVRSTTKSISQRRRSAFMDVTGGTRQDANWQQQILDRVAAAHSDYFRHYAELQIEPPPDAEIDNDIYDRMVAAGAFERPTPASSSLGAIRFAGDAPRGPVDREPGAPAADYSALLEEAAQALLRGEPAVAYNRARAASLGDPEAVEPRWLMCVSSLSRNHWDDALEHYLESVNRGLPVMHSPKAVAMIVRQVGLDSGEAVAQLQAVLSGLPSTGIAEIDDFAQGGDRLRVSSEATLEQLAAAYQSGVRIEEHDTHTHFVLAESDQVSQAEPNPAQHELTRWVLRRLIERQVWLIPLLQEDGQARWVWTSDVAARMDPKSHYLLHETLSRAAEPRGAALSNVSAAVSTLARDRLLADGQMLMRADSFQLALDRELEAAPTSLTLWLAAFAFEPVSAAIDVSTSDGVAQYWAVARAQRADREAWPVASMAGQARGVAFDASAQGME